MVLCCLASCLTSLVWRVLAGFGILAGLATFLPYVVATIGVSLLPPVNLRKKYDAKWALVTGASSGIGKSLAVKCAAQGMNVCLVALPDNLLEATHKELTKRFKKLQFRKIGVNLGSSTSGYLEQVAEETKDISVQVIFANAGYMATGFFIQSPLERQLANIECNATSAVQITHHFVTKMVDAGLKGCVVYTSSAAASMPSPFTALYSATKSFLSSFAAGLAAEVKSKGIDVCVVHPSPVATRFYDKAHKIDMLDFFKKFSVDPDTLPEKVFRAIGRTVWTDIGTTAIVFRLMMKVVDYNFLSTLLSHIAHLMPDYKRHDKKKD
eukprot:CAMPEP_0198239020 /NCGR_PEP_ID=MMETSP1446-20131203/4545_1 /TAXON_ID=1461542 ORGANISM="Unidentified sp, Strain CCMP2111" /NCGR_SAMPLE_ID=MMETSP1446 /ASSEMBLY_ACC=CAM_ASM_001112 /LENGTH=323 /DNA_ID=CAMNT_0043921549 /DNA_START=223 /DNA_END=1194 /DNA_ORIENTATION=-